MSRPAVGQRTEQGVEVGGGLDPLLQRLAQGGMIQIGGPRGKPVYQVGEERRLTAVRRRFSACA